MNETNLRYRTTPPSFPPPADRFRLNPPDEEARNNWQDRALREAGIAAAAMGLSAIITNIANAAGAASNYKNGYQMGLEAGRREGALQAEYLVKKMENDALNATVVLAKTGGKIALGAAEVSVAVGKGVLNSAGTILLGTGECAVSVVKGTCHGINWTVTNILNLAWGVSSWPFVKTIQLLEHISEQSAKASLPVPVPEAVTPPVSESFPSSLPELPPPVVSVESPGTSVAGNLIAVAKDLPFFDRLNQLLHHETKLILFGTPITVGDGLALTAMAAGISMIALSYLIPAIKQKLGPVQEPNRV